jgi:hypothetical protein
VVDAPIVALKIKESPSHYESQISIDEKFFDVIPASEPVAKHHNNNKAEAHWT